MKGILTPRTKNPKPLEPSTQATNKDEKVFEKEEHQLIYRAFLDTLKNPEKQIQQEIEEIAKKLQEKLSEQEKEKLEKHLAWLQNENEKKIFTFVLENRGKIFNDVNQKIKSLSEENFLQFLIYVFEKIREKNLASKENLENNKIKEVVDECVNDIRGTEAKDSLIKFAGWPLGIKGDPKNISSYFINGLKEKIPFLGKDKKEEDKPPLSDEEIVTTFLRKILLPISFSITSILIFGPTTLVIVAAVIGEIFAIKGGFEVLFSNNKKGTLYNPDTEKEKEWGSEISSKISAILKTPVKGAGRDNQPAEKRPNVPEQVKENQESFRKKEEDKRRQKEEKTSTLPLNYNSRLP
ncbi:hypothetical protein [Wolbachia pipientis]|uniref:hypothetical protein n=1 Tax=Wolbachia pipientis TaxID=955 RepID=UPI0025A35E2B|nr:hypothetical protein [Wolbachia pipientis]MDM8335045.1 hypothetical protein [Wolbachia pipientis]